MPQKGRSSESSTPAFLAGYVSLVYLLFASLWIYFSDRMLMVLVSDLGRHRLWQTGKGTLFVLASAALIYFLLWRVLRGREDERRRAEAELLEANRRLRALGQAVQHMTSARDIPSVMGVIRTAIEEIGIAGGAFFILRTAGECHCIRDGTAPPFFKSDCRFPGSHTLCAWAASMEKPLILRDFSGAPESLAEACIARHAQSAALLPIRAGAPVGVVGFYWSTPHTPDADDMNILHSLADAASVAIENVQLLTELERRVSQRTRQLEEANRELEAFSYSVSHDLRTPLRAIDGYTRILLEDYMPHLGAEGERICTVISDSTRRMGQLIDDLLSFSRIGRVAISFQVVDMKKFAQSVFMEVASSGDRERIDFMLGTLPPAMGDPALLRQVWINLIGNAVKFSSGKSRAVVEVSAEETAEETVFTVRDNGAGFDPQYAHKLFGVFQRLHSSREFEGTGVGLAIVQRILSRHGGRIWAEGFPGAGAAFHFALKREGPHRKPQAVDIRMDEDRQHVAEMTVG